MTDEQIVRVVVEALVAIFLGVQVLLGRKKAEAAEKKADSAEKKVDQALQVVQRIDNRLQQVLSQAVNVTTNVYYAGVSGTAETRVQSPSEVPPPLAGPERQAEAEAGSRTASDPSRST